MTDDRNKQDDSGQGAEQRRDAMLLRLLKTPPQPRPKRERPKASDKRKSDDQA